MNKQTVRIDKYLAHLGVASRRNIGEFLKKKIVTTNGERVFEPGTRVSPTDDTILINNNKLHEPNLVYYLVNKPLGVVSTAADEIGRPMVTSLIPTKERVYPVGRLDQDSTGLILLTNDGALANTLTHPRYHIPKVYHVLVTGVVTEAKLQRIRTGIDLDDGRTAPAEIKKLKEFPNKILLEITLHEGKKRQIRRMCATLRIHVLELKRIRMGKLQLGSLKPGMFRKLTAQEIEELKKLSSETKPKF